MKTNTKLQRAALAGAILQYFQAQELNPKADSFPFAPEDFEGSRDFIIKDPELRPIFDLVHSYDYWYTHVGGPRYLLEEVRDKLLSIAVVLEEDGASSADLVALAEKIIETEMKQSREEYSPVWREIGEFFSRLYRRWK